MKWLAAIALLAVAQPSASAPPKPAGGVVRVEHHDPAALPARGPTNALVTVELFFSPGQNTRTPLYKLLERLQAQHPSRIRLVYRVTPSGAQARLPFAAIHAQVEGKFFELLDALNNGPAALNDKQLADIAKKVGIDADRMMAVISKPPRAYEKLLEDNERRRKQRIRGNPSPPSVLFNGRMPQSPSAALGMNDLEKEYLAARELAEDLIDRGADPAALEKAFDQLPLALPQEIIVQPGTTDDSEEAPDAVLVTPPLDLRGLPSYGPAEAATTIAVLCSPTSSNCFQPMKAAQVAQERYPEAVRVVWAPYFDVGREDAAYLSLLGDAAMCAEKVGITLEERERFGGEASPGWRWVEAVLAEANSRHRPTKPDKIIDKVADKLRVDRRAFATCRAQLAGTTISFIEAARHANVGTATPSTIVGGRAYGPVTDVQTLQQLVEAEVAPGVLGEAAPSWLGR